MQLIVNQKLIKIYKLKHCGIKFDYILISICMENKSSLGWVKKLSIFAQCFAAFLTFGGSGDDILWIVACLIIGLAYPLSKLVESGNPDWSGGLVSAIGALIVVIILGLVLKDSGSFFSEFLDAISTKGFLYVYLILLVLADIFTGKDNSLFVGLALGALIPLILASIVMLILAVIALFVLIADTKSNANSSVGSSGSSLMGSSRDRYWYDVTYTMGPSPKQWTGRYALPENPSEEEILNEMKQGMPGGVDHVHILSVKKDFKLGL